MENFKSQEAHQFQSPLDEVLLGEILIVTRQEELHLLELICLLMEDLGQMVELAEDKMLDFILEMEAKDINLVGVDHKMRMVEMEECGVVVEVVVAVQIIIELEYNVVEMVVLMVEVVVEVDILIEITVEVMVVMVENMEEAEAGEVHQVIDTMENPELVELMEEMEESMPKMEILVSIL